MEVPLITVIYSEDEWYPIYCLFKDNPKYKSEYDKRVSIPISLYEQHLAATAEFERIQTIIEKLVK
jgi:hypothetical protein